MSADIVNSSGLQHKTRLWSIEHVTGNDTVPMQLAQCRFIGLAISNAKILINFSSKTYRSNFIKQHSETVIVWIYQNAGCSFKKIIVIYYNFWHIFVPDRDQVPCLFVGTLKLLAEWQEGHPANKTYATYARGLLLWQLDINQDRTS